MAKEPHKIMTPEEYEHADIQEWHEVCRNYDGCGATFVPVCEKCGRFVKADKTILINGLDELVKQTNATCKKCGRVEMPFEGYF